MCFGRPASPAPYTVGVEEARHMRAAVGWRAVIAVVLLFGAGPGCRRTQGEVEYHSAADGCDVDVFYVHDGEEREVRLQRPPEAASSVAAVPLTRGQRFSMSARPMGSCIARCWVEHRGVVIARGDSSDDGLAVCAGVVP